ncbi:MAG: hypothetical protein JNM00_11745 [Flavobacteriales bacterium]|nr:hypothetical protein [Flavobacteriales bacterium]
MSGYNREKFRVTENLHILFWLIKDTCWLIEYKTLGAWMIAPTVAVAIWLTWKSRSDWPEFSHNMAVTLWISANSWWMINEFFWDDIYKSWSLFPFLGGLLILAAYYLPHWLKAIAGRGK